MKTNVLSKSEFVDVIETIQKTYDFENKVYDVFANNDQEAPSFPSNIGTVIDILNRMFELEITDYYGSDIDYFCYELNFGRDYEPGCAETDGEDVDLSTAEKLYDYITRDK